MFPPQFSDLEKYADWALPTEVDRHQKRMASPYEEVEAFYVTVLEKIDPVMDHLNSFKLNEMPPEEEALKNLVLSLAEVSPAVEFYQSTQVRGGLDSFRMKPTPFNT
ncbi:MAG: hypothetical protein RIE22_05745 [Alphaproteobacteria bacterium]